MAVSPVPRGTTNPRNVIVEWTRAIIDRVIERPERVSISEITDQAMQRFGDDRAFMTSLALMNIREIVQAAVRETIAETRGPSKRVIVRDMIVTPQEMVSQTPALMAALALRWGRFREWNGELHVVLPAMTRIDLLSAAAIRRERAARENAYATFFERLAARLPDDTTTVGAAIPFDEIEREYAQVQREHGRLDDEPGTGTPAI